MKLVKLEFDKCRRRKVLLVCAAVVAAELLWFGMYLTRQDGSDLVQGWLLLFYNLAVIDAIILPISVATIASRNLLNLLLNWILLRMKRGFRKYIKQF